MQKPFSWVVLGVERMRKRVVTGSFEERSLGCVLKEMEGVEGLAGNDGGCAVEWLG